MISPRKKIRTDVVERLTAALPELSGRVFPARVETIDDVELPCACVYSRDEAVETADPNPSMQVRTLSLAVVVYVKGNGDLDDVIDDLAEKIETELLSGDKQRSNGLFQSVELINTEIGFAEMGRKPIGAGRLIFEITYEKQFQ